jgi:protein gp37
MAENSKISWTDHTLNFWIGCTKVSPGCKFCYAEVDTFARRERSNGRELWGPGGERHRTSEALWKNPYKWEKNSQWVECTSCSWRGNFKETSGPEDACPNCDRGYSMKTTRQRVFVSSLADICEIHPQITNDMRKEIAQIVKDCRNLDFLFLTKRIENFNNLWLDLFGGTLPENLWVGTTVEDQKWADIRIPELLKVPAKVRFLSCEPLLGPVHFNGSKELRDAFENKKIHWVIGGGESGARARPMITLWIRSLRDQCKEAGIPFHFKQWGEWYPCLDRDTGEQRDDMVRIGKKNSGRLLDGVEHNGFPEVIHDNL